MNILVTGGAGFIGSVVCELLAKLDHYIIVIDDLRDGRKEALSESIQFVESNYGDMSVLRAIFSERKIDFVFHLAALANVPLSVGDPLAYYENNVSNTVNLLKIMDEFSVKKIIFSSTAAVYGNPEYIPMDEDHLLSPTNPYGWSKLMCERIIQSCAAAYGLKYMIFRYFCAAGATESHGESRLHETHLIPVVLDQILGKKKIMSVFGNDFATKDGTGIRDFIHVWDIANAHVLGMDKIQHHPNSIYNLGTSNGYSVMEIIEKVAKLCKVPVTYKICPRRLGDPSELVTSFDKAKKELNWFPTMTIEDIILSAYEWRKAPRY